MWSIAARAIGFGLLGLVLTPIVVAFTILVLAHAFDPRCGTPGDSGGCEMGAASVGFFSALPGAALGAGFGVWSGLRRRRSSSSGKAA